MACTSIQLRYSAVNCETACSAECTEYWTDGTPGAIVPGDRIYQDAECEVCALPGYYADNECEESNQGCFTVPGPEDCLISEITSCEGESCNLVTLAYSPVSCEEACINDCTQYYTNGTPGALIVGNTLYLDSECNSCAPDGYYADVPCGEYAQGCFTHLDCIITEITSCEAGDGCTPCDSIENDQHDFVHVSTVPVINTWKTLWENTTHTEPTTGAVISIDRHYLKQIYIQNCCEDEDWDTSFCIRFYNKSNQIEALLLNGHKLESCERFTVLTNESPLYLRHTTRIDIAVSRVSGWSISAIIEQDNTYTGKKSDISTINA